MNAEKTGRFINELRKEKEMTQLQLAETLHVSDKAISRWETGKGFPDIGSLEVIAQTLGISVAELLRGERFVDEHDRQETETLTSDLLSLLGKALDQKKIAQLIMGFLLGAIVLTLLLVHLNAPIYIKDAKKALQLEHLADGRIVAILPENVAGYELEQLNDPDGGVMRTISCYETLLHRLGNKNAPTLVILGDSQSPDYIYYYPTVDGDQLLYARDNAPAFSMVTLPRLVYNYWILLGIVATIIGMICYYLLRRKYYAGRILKAALLPLSLTLSILLSLMGSHGEIYDAAYYFSGILLLTLLIYILLLYVVKRRRKNI